jgi:hypothetical protein
VEKDPKQWIWWAIPIVVVLAAGAALYVGRHHKEPVDAAPAAATVVPPAAAPSLPPNYPIEPTATNKPLPSLDSSDSPLQESLAEIYGRSLEEFLVPKDLIRHLVVTIDNLPRRKTAVPHWPLKPTAGKFTVTDNNDPTLSADNAARYAPLIKLIQSSDTAQVVAVYKQYYPLFQQAYVDLGYPNGYFNNRLIEVIDHLLATPELNGEVKLTQPSVFYEYADPTLEERSAGQKLLMRMGNGNAATVKAKLRELRQQIAKQQDAAG